MPSHSPYTAEKANRTSQPRFDPLHPEFIRQDEEGSTEFQEFEEDVGLSRTAVKRKHVRTVGYDSDSSQEGDNKKKKAKKTQKEEDDDDMFADPPPSKLDGEGDENKDDDLDAYGKLKRKKVSFVSYETFEGQEISDHEQNPEDEVESVPSTPHESDNENIDEEVGMAGSRKHAPKIEKFNLRREQEEGAFTEDGTYIRKMADPNVHQDAWMEGLTKGQIRRAREGMERQQQREIEREKREAQEQQYTSTEHLEQLIRCLQPKETPLEALARLNQGKKRKWQPTQRWKKNKMSTDTGELPASEEDDRKVKESIESITTHADRLLVLGNLNIYSTSRERLIMLYQEDTGERFREGRSDENANGNQKWEYRWPGNDEVFSGFSTEDMRNWKAGGFFGDGVLCRRLGSTDDWKSSTDTSF